MTQLSTDTIKLLKFINDNDSKFSEPELKSLFGEDGITRLNQLLESSFVERTNGKWEHGLCIYCSIGITLAGRDYLDQLNQDKSQRNKDKLWEIVKIFLVALLAAYFKDFVSWLITILK